MDVTITHPPTTPEKRLTAAADQWRASRAPAHGRTITQQDVDDIAALLAAADVPVTYRAIHDVFGSGSPNVITPMLRATWTSGALRKRIVEATQSPKIPPALMKLWDAALAAADVATKALHREAREHLESTRCQIEMREEALMRREQQVEERLSEQQQRLAEALNSLALARQDTETAARQAESLRADLANARQETESAREDARTRGDRLAKSQEALSASNQRNNALLKDLEHLKTLHDLEKQRASDAAEQLAKAQHEITATQKRNADLVLKHANLQLELNDTKTELAQERNALTSNATRIEQMEGELEGLRETLASVGAEKDSLEAAYNVRGHDLVRQQNQVAQLRAAVAQHEKREADLRALKEDLRLVTRERDQLLRHPPGLSERLQAIETLLQAGRASERA